MNPKSPASSVNLAGGRGIGYWPYAFPIPSLAVLGALLIGFLVLSVWAKRSSGDPKVAGNARVLSLAKSADSGRGSWCRIELEVTIPGREPYAVLVEKNLGPAQQAAMQPGGTVAVAVGAANPHDVELKLPATPSPSPGVGRRLPTLAAYAAGIVTLALLFITIVAGICAGHLFPF